MTDDSPISQKDRRSDRNDQSETSGSRDDKALTCETVQPLLRQMRDGYRLQDEFLKAQVLYHTLTCPDCMTLILSLGDTHADHHSAE